MLPCRDAVELSGNRLGNGVKRFPGRVRNQMQMIFASHHSIPEASTERTCSVTKAYESCMLLLLSPRTAKSKVLRKPSSQAYLGRRTTCFPQFTATTPSPSLESKDCKAYEK